MECHALAEWPAATPGCCLSITPPSHVLTLSTHTQPTGTTQVKFPERSLKFKVAGGRVERDQWLEALKAAKQHHAAAEQERRSGAGRLEHLQKV